MWDVDKAVAHLNSHASKESQGRCAAYVRQAIEAGGVTLVRQASAKNYGDSLEKVAFREVRESEWDIVAGDVVVIQPIAGHPHGHMAMYNGSLWVSDFVQQRGYYPGPSYRKQKPPVAFYRHVVMLARSSIERLRLAHA